MKPCLTFSLVAWSCLSVAIPVFAKEGSRPQPAQEMPAAALKVGDKAPVLNAGKVLQGGSTAFESGKCYMVEYWATWCAPCVASIPHLESLHQKYKDKGLTIISVNAGETNEKAVRKFIDKRKDKMTYTVTLPGSEYRKTPNWPQMAGENGIPCAFLVNKDGVIAAISHPMYITDAVIEPFLAGEPFEKALASEVEKINEQWKKDGELPDKINEATSKKDWDTLEKLIAQFEKEKPEKQKDIHFSKLDLALGRNKPDKVIEQIRSLIKIDNEVTAYVIGLSTQVQPAVSFSKQQFEELEAIAKAIVPNDSMSEFSPDDFSAMIAVEPLARVLFLKGDVAGANKALDSVKFTQSGKEKASYEFARDQMKSSFKNGKMPGTFPLELNAASQHLKK